jgi:hypothetical protein
MLFLKRGLMAAGALALAAMLLNFVAPRAAHALVATAVQVMNTSATPVPTRDVDAAGRNPFRLSCTGVGNCQTPPVPAGNTFVVESIFASVAGTGAWLQFNVQTPGLGGVGDESIAFAPLVQSTPSIAIAFQNISMYESAGSIVFVSGGPSVTGAIYFTLIGHLVPTP